MIKATIPPEQLRALLETVIREAPPLTYGERLSEEDMRWIARAETLVEIAGGTSLDAAEFKLARQSLGSLNHNRAALMAPLLNSYYRMELLAPPAGHGRFIAPGDTWGGYAALVRLVQRECERLLIVDPYLDATVVTDVLPHAKAKQAALHDHPRAQPRRTCCYCRPEAEGRRRSAGGASIRSPRRRCMIASFSWTAKRGTFHSRSRTSPSGHQRR